MRNRIKPLFVTFIIVLLTALVGCQAVGGLNINKALISNLDILSSEGKASLSIELMLDEEAADESGTEDLNLMKLFNKSSLNLFNMKMQDVSTLSADGEFVFTKGKIPFSFSLTSEELVIQLEGAEKPVVISLSDSLEDVGSEEELQGIQEELTAQSRAIMKSVGTYLINNLPNSGKISVESIDKTINGETINLHKIHSEIYGSEIVGLVKKLLVSLREDEAGLKEMLSQLYDILMPIIQPILEEMLNGSFGEEPLTEEDTGASYEDEEYFSEEAEDTGAFSEDEESFLEEGEDAEASSDDEETPSESAMTNLVPNLMTNLLKNKTFIVEFLFTSINTLLDTYLIEFDKLVEEMTEGEGSEETAAYLSDDNYLKVDLYVDSGMAVRKTEAELVIAPKLAYNEGLLGIKILASSEVWNINKPVVIKSVDTSGKVFKLGDDSNANFINSVKKDSLLYDILKNDLHLTRKNISLILDENSLSEGYETGYQRPYIKNNTTMVPTAFISEQLDAEVSWDSEKQQVTIVDDLTGNHLVFTIGSKVALVNGEEYTLTNQAEVYYGRSFVPLAFIAQHLDAEVHWDGATKSVTITRD